MYFCQEHEKCIRFNLITASKGHNLPLFVLSKYLKDIFLYSIDKNYFVWDLEIRYLDATWSSLHPFCTPCYQRLKCLSSTGRMNALALTSTLSSGWVHTWSCMREWLALYSREGFPQLCQGATAGLKYQLACWCGEPNPVLWLSADPGPHSAI